MLTNNNREMINHCFAVESSTEYAYFQFCTEKNSIENCEEVDDEFVRIYQPDMNRVFLLALDNKNEMTIKHLLNSKKINLRNNKIFCQAPLGEKFLVNIDGQPKSAITFTHLQAVLVWASKEINRDLAFAYRVIKMMIETDVHCLLPDSVGNSVGYYLLKMNRARSPKGFYLKPDEYLQKWIGEIGKLVYHHTLMQSAITFILVSSQKNSSSYLLPSELKLIISYMTMMPPAQNTNALWKEINKSWAEKLSHCRESILTKLCIFPSRRKISDSNAEEKELPEKVINKIAEYK